MPCLTACLLHRQLTPTVDVGTPPASGSSLLDTSATNRNDHLPQRSSHAERMCSGTVANRNKSWFTEHSDKMKSTKTHLYWCMKNCTGNADDLRVMIMNISRHYQRDH
ncbi:hypothetical protein EMCRGX_G006080 [Ephydatia muelleri]